MCGPGVSTPKFMRTLLDEMELDVGKEWRHDQSYSSVAFLQLLQCWGTPCLEGYDSGFPGVSVGYLIFYINNLAA